MKQFYYYVPKSLTSGLTAAQVRALGITWLLDDDKDPVCAEIVNNGPDGGQGILFARAAGEKPHNIGYYKARQTWERAPGADYWIGYYTDAKPGPEDLARPFVEQKHAVRMRDGNDWIVPPVRLIGGTLNVPFGLKLDASGALTQKALPEYAELVKSAEIIWNWQNGIADESPSYAELMQIIALSMGRMYRMGLPELNMLELLDSENVGGAALAITDWPTFCELKKKECDVFEESSITSG